MKFEIFYIYRNQVIKPIIKGYLSGTSLTETIIIQLPDKNNIIINGRLNIQAIIFTIGSIRKKKINCRKISKWKLNIFLSVQVKTTGSLK